MEKTWLYFVEKLQMTDVGTPYLRRGNINPTFIFFFAVKQHSLLGKEYTFNRMKAGCLSSENEIHKSPLLKCRLYTMIPFKECHMERVRKGEEWVTL
jgi:hypothetical protein